MWALLDVEASGTLPTIAILDNDDFKIDSITGNANRAHRTNVMFVHPENYEKKNETLEIDVKKRKDIYQFSSMSIPLEVKVNHLLIIKLIH